MIKRNWKIFFTLVSQALDLAAIAAAGGVIFFLKGATRLIYSTPHHNLLIGIAFFAVTYLIVASMLGLYRGSFHLSLRFQTFILFRAFIFSLLISLSLNSLSQTFVGQKSVIAFTLSAGLLLCLARLIVNGLNLAFQKMGFGIHNVLIAGDGEETERLIQRFSIYPELGYSVKGIIVKEKGKRMVEIPQYTRADLSAVIRNEHIDRILVPTPDFSLNGHSYLQPLSEEYQIKLKVISDEAEEILKFSRIYDIGGVTIVSPPRYHVVEVKKAIKRLFDIVGSIVALIILSPIFLITILAIMIESGRPIFFFQRRASVKGGKEFNFFKFRSMLNGAEKLKSTLIEKNESDGALFKMKNDPRITRVGRIIRKTSIDELPQLINVLKGDMSLVGPRPLPLADFNRAQESPSFWDAIKERNSVKPGMTGLWQISGRSEIKFKEMILLDMYYVENNSLLFDLEILFETISVVLFRRGAY